MEFTSPLSIDSTVRLQGGVRQSPFLGTDFVLDNSPASQHWDNERMSVISKASSIISVSNNLLPPVHESSWPCFF